MFYTGIENIILLFLHEAHIAQILIGFNNKNPESDIQVSAERGIITATSN